MGMVSQQQSPLPARKQRRKGIRWVRYVVLLLVVLLVAAGTGSYGFVRRSLPQVTGTLKLPGLTAPVTVYRDEWGVPHIEAQSRLDLYRAQGYVTAQDRLWQMDLLRRTAAGRLSEVMGASQIETDKFLRSIMLRRSAELSVGAYSAPARESLEAFVAGVNAYIDEVNASGKLPIEFTILGYKPEPWSMVDSASIGKLMAYDLGGNWRGEVYMYQLRKLVGDRLAQQLLPAYPANGITIMKYGAEAPAQRHVAELPPDDSQIDLSGLLRAAIFPDEFAGSNNWVVSGKLTASGKPLLANDPHLGLRTPAIWYQTHLSLTGEHEQMNVIGVTFPGAPGIVVGHNDKIAWGVTNTGPDVQDLYIERRNPQNPYQFEYEGKWEDATVHKETIKVKGQADVPYEVVVTRHGPIVSEVVGSEKNRPSDALALKWTAHLPTTELEAVLEFNRATNWTEFREALRKFQVPTQNFVFASVDGTIAYHAGGIVPIRANGNGTTPVPGHISKYEWTGFIPFERMPEVVNPSEGFIATANNKVVDDAYPYLITTSWAQPYRQMRIVEVLKGKTGFTVQDMQALQSDYANLQAREHLPVLVPLVEKATLTDTEVGALSLLKEWNHVDSADQGAPLIYHLWWRQFTRQLYEPIMGEDLYKRMSDQGNVTDEIIRQAAKGIENEWLQQAGGLGKLAEASFKAAVADVVAIQGKDPQKWSWGQFHRIGPAHPLGAAVKQLGWFLNTTMQPVGGSGLTVGAMSFKGEDGTVTNSAPWRQTVDLADIQGNSFDIVTPGQSGHFLSQWYDDQHALHVKGQYHPQAMNPSLYQKGQKLVLEP